MIHFLDIRLLLIKILSISFLITLATIILLLKTGLSQFVLDHPNERSLHTQLTPRTGGLAVMAGVLIVWFALSVNWYWLLLTFSLMAISLVDDIWNLSAKSRLMVQFLIVLICVLMVLQGASWLLVMPIVFLLTWMTNLYNFMDGSDGLAGGMGLFGFTAYAVAAYLAGNLQLTLMCASVSASCLAFLLFNFYPAKIFMGDSGSIPLGFLMGALGLYGWQYQVWPFWFPFLVFSPFIVDATITLIKRLLNKEKIWQAHKSHYYQRLIQLGCSHRKTALVEFMLMLCTSVFSIILMKQPIIFVILGLFFWVLIYFILMRWIDKRWQDNQYALSN